jgi:hypothetical protein
VGYSLFRLTEGRNDTNFPAGWLVSGAGRVTSWMWIAGNVSGNYKTFSDGDTLWIHTYQGGPRVVFQTSRARFFGQFLLGGLTARANEGGGNSASSTRFNIEPGGGVDISLTTRTALRVGVGFPMFFINEEDFHETINAFRFEAGMVFALGGR